MKRSRIAGGAVGAGLVLLALVAGYRALERDVEPAAAAPRAATPSTAPAPPAAAKEARPGFLYGRITTDAGTTYEGRLRWGVGNQEAFWSDYFNGWKDENLWAAHVPPERLPKERHSIGILGFEIAHRERPVDLGRHFMARFGDIRRIEAHGRRDVRVTLKSGTVFDLDRFGASDFDDGVRVWDDGQGVVDLYGGVERAIAGPVGAGRRVRAIELLPTAPLAGAPGRLHGTVRTGHGAFTGFLQWDRQDSVGTDELVGRTAEGRLGLRFDTLRSVARRSRDSFLVTLRDGREIVLSGKATDRGIYVEDRRYGRVLVSWDAFERVDFSDLGGGGSGPAYGDFPPGGPLTGSVATRGGRRLAGRLVYDLDESETTETLDAPSRGVDYTIPFGLVASIAPRRGRVTLRSGEELQLDRTGDLGEGNAGMLIFVEGRERPEYVPWTDVERVDLDR
jgi:hypothetical protein